MIPKDNPQEFVKRYGELYYLREFDYLPAPLKYYDKNISKAFMKAVDNGTFHLFKTKAEADIASYEMRRKYGIKFSDFDRTVKNKLDYPIYELKRILNCLIND